MGKKHDIERLTGELASANELINEQEEALGKATKERDNLRRQLQRIREAERELHRTIYPELINPSGVLTTPGILPALPGLSPIAWST